MILKLIYIYFVNILLLIILKFIVNNKNILNYFFF